MPLKELLTKIEEETGFKCYEPVNSNNPQFTFYGISANFTAFKTLVSGKIETGTIAYLLDTQDSYMYYNPTDTWY